MEKSDGFERVDGPDSGLYQPPTPKDILLGEIAELENTRRLMLNNGADPKLDPDLNFLLGKLYEKQSSLLRMELEEYLGP